MRKPVSLCGKFASCLAVAAMLAIGMPGYSDVLCVSPSGHVAIESWASPCCHPGERPAGKSVRDQNPCSGCTDYPLALPTEDGAKAVAIPRIDMAALSAAPPLLVPQGWTLDEIVPRLVLPLETSPGLTLSLRC